MSFPLSILYVQQLSSSYQRPRALVVEEMLKDSLQIEKDVKDVQELVNKMKNTTSQDQMMMYISQMENDLQDVYNRVKQIYTDFQELMKHTN